MCGRKLDFAEQLNVLSFYLPNLKVSIAIQFVFLLRKDWFIFMKKINNSQIC